MQVGSKHYTTREDLPLGRPDSGLLAAPKFESATLPRYLRKKTGGQTHNGEEQPRVEHRMSV